MILKDKGELNELPMVCIGPTEVISLGNHKSYFEFYLNKSRTKGLFKWFIYSLDKTFEYNLFFKNNIFVEYEANSALPKFVLIILNRNGLFINE